MFVGSSIEVVFSGGMLRSAQAIRDQVLMVDFRWSIEMGAPLPWSARCGFVMSL